MKKDILVAGIYLADQANNIREIVNVLSKSSHYNVIQKWAAIAKNEIENDLKQFTVLKLQEKTPKFKILNLILSGEDLSKYAFLLIVDDDIALPDDFVDNYLTAVQKYDFALAQPARTHDSYIDHAIVEQVDGLAARKTRFVEIGPLFSIRKDLYKFILPFDENAGMGWGLDFIWPSVIEDVGLNMGIVDAFPIEHKMRAPVINYSHKKTEDEMNAYLKTKKHLSKVDAFRVLESYALIPVKELPLISVIIPTYNCRAYLCRAIDSVLAQKLENVEVIIVDDASTDDTQDILKKTYGNNPAVRVILHTENKKLGASRNTGIDAAKGKYIFFLNADDWLETGALAHLASIAEKYNAEIVACGVCKAWENGKKEPFHAHTFSCNGGREALYYYADHRIGSIVWNKLYLLDLIKENNLRFVVPYWHEDVIFTAKAIYSCRKYISIKNEYCNYFQNENSIINQAPTPLHLESYIKLYVDMIDFIKSIDICNAEDGNQICWRLLKAHCSNELWPKLIRYASTKSSSDWELLCWNTCHKILGVDGYAVADFLIKATNTTLSNTAELERTKTELECELERTKDLKELILLEGGNYLKKFILLEHGN